MDKEELQKKFMEYQMIEQKVGQMKEQLENAEEQSLQAAGTIENLQDLSQLKEDSEILVPVNNGMFAKATLKKSDRILLNVGTGIVVDKSFDEAVALVGKQQEEIRKVKEMLTRNIHLLQSKTQELEEELQKGMQDVQTP